MRIFLSYGHDECTSLAVCIKEDLIASNHEVWFDVDRLHSGVDWELYIEDGITWAASVPNEGLFVLLMTPHSVRRPNGYCLNELSRALSRNLRIVPVMLRDVEPPLSICRLQWLDFRECAIFPCRQERYGILFNRLLMTLVPQSLEVDATQARLLNYLTPLPYAAEVARHMARFTGREWLMAEVEDWLASSNRVLWLTGEPGVGKSAIAAWLTDRRPEVAAFHYCRYGNSERTDARKSLLSIAYQLSTQLPEYRHQLNALQLDAVRNELNPEALFDRLFVAPLHALPHPGRPVVIVVDGLDEATENGENKLATILGSDFDLTPEWLRLIITSRPHETELQYALQSLTAWKIEAARPGNLHDIRQFLCRELRGLNHGQDPTPAVVNAIVEKSEGLFLYAELVRADLAAERLSLTRIDAFPRGLRAIFAQFFARVFPDLDAYGQRWRPLLEAICAAREPIPIEVLEQLFGWCPYEANDVISGLTSIFPAIDGTVRPFHESIRDWLTQHASAGRYFVAPDIGQKRLADFGWKLSRDGADMPRYITAHLPFHLAACGRTDDLLTLLLEYPWVEAKLNATSAIDLMGDYDLVAESDLNEARLPAKDRQPQLAPLRFEQSKAARQLQSALRLSAHALLEDKVQLSGQMLGRILADCAPELREFRAAAARPTSVARMLPVRSGLASAGGALLRSIPYSGPIVLLSLTPDGRTIVVGGRAVVDMFDLNTGTRRKRVACPNLDAMAVIDEDTILVAGTQLDSEDPRRSSFRVRNLISGRELLRVEECCQAKFAVANDRSSVLFMGTNRCSCGAAHTGDPHWGCCIVAVFDVNSGQSRILADERCPTAQESRYTRSPLIYAVPPDFSAVVYGDGARLMCRSLESAHVLWQVVLPSTTGWSSVAYTADATVLAVAKTGTAYVLRASDGSVVRAQAMDEPAVAVTACSGGRVLTTHTSTEELTAASVPLRLWDVESGALLWGSRHYYGNVPENARMLKDGRILATSSDTLLVIDTRKLGEPIGILHPSFHLQFEVTADEAIAVSASSANEENPTIRIWNLAADLNSHSVASSHALSLSITPDGHRALSSDIYYGLKLWDLESGVQIKQEERVCCEALGWQFVNDFEGHAAVCLLKSRQAMHEVSSKFLAWWNPRWGWKEASVRLTDEKMFNRARHLLSANGETFALFNGPELVTWDLRGIRTNQGECGGGPAPMSTFCLSIGIEDAAFTPDGKKLVCIGQSESGEHSLIVVDSWNQKEIAYPVDAEKRLQRVAVSQDGQLAVVASADGVAHVFGLETGQMVQKFAAGVHWSIILPLCDSRVLMTFEHDSSVLLDIREGSIKWRVPWWAHSAKQVSFARFPEWVAIAHGQNIGVFDIADGRRIASFTADTSIDFCRISPDGRRVACIDGVGEVHIIRIENPSEL